MAGGTSAQVILTCVFAAGMVSYGWHVTGAATWRSALASFLHLIMCGAMIAMMWPWGMQIPTVVYVLVFTASALYFVSLTTVLATTDDDCSLDVGRHRYHAMMMISMVAMTGLMSVAMPNSQGASHDMPGMSMPGSSMTAAVPTWAVVAAAIGAFAYLVVTLTSLYLTVRGPRRRYLDVFIGAAMAASFALMIN